MQNRIPGKALGCNFSRYIRDGSRNERRKEGLRYGGGGGRKGAAEKARVKKREGKGTRSRNFRPSWTIAATIVGLLAGGFADFRNPRVVILKRPRTRRRRGPPLYARKRRTRKVACRFARLPIPLDLDAWITQRPYVIFA